MISSEKFLIYFFMCRNIPASWAAEPSKEKMLPEAQYHSHTDRGPAAPSFRKEEYDEWIL